MQPRRMNWRADRAGTDSSPSIPCLLHDADEAVPAPPALTEALHLTREFGSNSWHL